MFKKAQFLTLVLVCLMFLSGCALFGKYKGWEYVRIEDQIPHKECVYKVQEACDDSGAECYNYLKRKTVSALRNVLKSIEICLNSQGEKGVTHSPFLLFCT